MYKNIKISIITLITFCFTVGCNSQKTEGSKFDKIYGKEQYLEDIDKLANTLTETHPNPYKFTSKEGFWNLIQESKNTLSDSTVFAQFIWKINKIVSSLDCSHTQLGYFNQEDQILPIELRFPIEVRLIDDRLYISDPLINRNNLKAGTEIFSINGKNVEGIKKDVYQHISSQGKSESYKRQLFNAYSTSFIPYSLGFPDTYSVIIKGKKEPVELVDIQNYKFKTRIKPNNPCQENLCLNFLKEDKIALLTLRSFDYYGDRYPTLTKFLDESFKEINSMGIKDLVLDVRMNGGGPSDASIHLLRYLTKEPFAYFSSSAFDEKKELVKPFENSFNGNVFVLINGDGGSTTGHFISLVKHLDLATLLGEELGSNQYCTGGQKEFKLSNTGITYNVGRYTYVTTATSLPEDRGILPDHNVVQGIQDYLNNIDTVLEYTLKLIEDD